jgi:hypothetical protein
MFDSRQDAIFLFATTSRPAVGLSQRVPELFLQGIMRPGLESAFTFLSLVEVKNA